jgi:hypothetical protein
MTIRLYSYAIIERGLTWNQVNEAIRLANASVAGKHFRYYFHKFDEDQGKSNGFSLLAMPNDLL